MSNIDQTFEQYWTSREFSTDEQYWPDVWALL